MKNILFYFCVVFNIIVAIYILNIKEEKTYLSVEVKGAVKNPGVYKLEEDSIVKDVIDKSGGLNNDADISITNLSKKLTDEMVVIIYTHEEITNSRINPSVVKYIDKECSCPVLMNDTCITEVITNNEGNIVSSGKVSINSATIEELTNLPSIGESKAIKIIEYRELNNGFKSVEEIKNVKGIGNSIYEKIKDYLTL